jgi:hypothetical protein
MFSPEKGVKFEAFELITQILKRSICLNIIKVKAKVSPMLRHHFLKETGHGGKALESLYLSTRWK